MSQHHAKSGGAEERKKKISRRPLKGNLAKAVTVVAVLFGVFHLLLATGFIMLSPMEVRTTHLAFALVLGFMLVPAFRSSPIDRPSWFDWGWVGLTMVSNAYMFFRFDQLVLLGGRHTEVDILMGGLTLVVLLEGARRSVSSGLVVLAVLALLFAYFGRSMPEPFLHTGFSAERIIQHLYMTGEGIYGFILGVSSTTIVTFIIFGAFLQAVGVSEFFNDLANTIAGKSRGGPAKIATISSSLMGTVSGDTSGNVATTGTFTIPLMKKVGYKPYFAGAIECAASAGGQLMPPVMGATAFIIADTLGIPYIEIAVAAILPAILYYVGVFATIHFRALSQGLKGMEDSMVPKFKEVVPKAYLVLPVVGIVYLLLKEYDPVYSAFWGGIVFTVILSFFKKETRMTWHKTVEILEQAARTTMGVAIACAVVGIVVGVASLSGVTITVADSVLQLTGGMLLPTLLLTMVVAMIMGMGLPTTACYVLTSISAAPILTMLGVPMLTAHLFVLYYGVLSALTPPVATGAYTAAGLAGAEPTKVGLASLRVALAGFVVPFLFIYHPSLLLGQEYSFSEAIVPFIFSASGIIFIAAGIEGHFKWKINWIGRLLLVSSGILLVFPEMITSLIGFALAAAALIPITKLGKNYSDDLPMTKSS
ncbi:TRAP transporter permease [Ammoniphilus sp. CFH 90114]|uniref:TRAP transporter permease n=1 Tax=Ammoniphilus sp. CFH 90114 TaxID=2493665 RepID=UPI0013E95B02|nr:TRAP transporter permease [Ammoniphilus sp. CFH 90114]